MDAIIARLLSDFEKGHMTRRQLIQSLALTVTAASATSTWAAAPEGKGFKTLAVNHISYQVKDYRVTRDFYADLMGMKVTGDNGQTECELVFGNSFMIPRNRPQRKGQPRPNSKVRGFVDHIAFTIDSWDKNAVEAELKRRGLKPRPDTENSFHITDPDGFDLQISGGGMKPEN
jgi:catechol 2,3-dioxygenase-like lactoylglutathione lyase family enzyme